MTEITFSQVGYDLARLNQHNVALEGFIRLMEGREVITGPTALSMRIALEDSISEMDGISGQDLSKGLKKIYVTIRNIIQWLLRTIGKAFEVIGMGMQRLGNAGKRNKERLAALGNDDMARLKDADGLKDHAFKVETLCIAGEFSGHDLEHVQATANMVRWLIGDYMGGVLKVFDNISTLVTKHTDDKDATEFLKTLGQLIGSSMSYPKVKQANEDLAPDFQIDSKHSINTVPMLGDHGLVMFEIAGAAGVFESGLDAAQNFLKVDIVPYNTKKELANDVIPLPSPEDLLKLNEITLGAVEFWNTEDGKVGAHLKKTTDTLNGLVATLEKSKSGAANTMAGAIALVLQHLGGAISHGSKWAGRTLTNELHYISKTIDQASGDSEESDDEE